MGEARRAARSRAGAAAGRPQREERIEPLHDPDPVLQAAWWYFVEDLSQAQIADRLGVSRASVHNYLRQARESGMVHVSVDAAVTARSRLAREVSSRFDLEAVYLAPDPPPGAAGDGPPDAEREMRHVAKAAAMWLDGLLPKGASVGVAWGETMYGVASQMPRRARGDLTFVQIVGSMASPFGFNAEACTSLIADRLGAACVNLYAPAVVSDASVARTLLDEPVIRQQIDRLNAVDVAIFAVGLCDASSHVVQAGVATLEELSQYHASGARAVIAGRFIDGAGRPLAGRLDGRVIGITLEQLGQVARRVLVSAGTRRSAALRAALSGGFATHLITDTASAGALLSD